MEMESTVPLQSTRRIRSSLRVRVREKNLPRREAKTTMTRANRRTPKERKSPRRTAKTMQPMEAMVNPMIQTVVSQKSRTPPIPPTMSLR